MESAHTYEFLLCEHCDYKAKSDSELKTHIEICHVSIRAGFPCDDCPTIFDTWAHLSKHMNEEHNEGSLVRRTMKGFQKRKEITINIVVLLQSIKKGTLF